MNTPKLRFEGFEGKWKISKLGKFLNHIGSGVTPRGGSSVYQTEGILFIRSQNVHFAGLKLKDVVYISDEINEKMKNSQLSDSDVLLNITGASIGRVTIVPLNFPKANVNQHVCILRTNEFLSPYFLKTFLESDYGQKNIFKDQAGQTREALNLDQIKSFNIGIPCIEEQKKLTQFFRLITQRVNLQQEKIRELEELKKGMMQKVFSQEIRFKDEDGGDFGKWEEKRLHEIVEVIDGDRGKSYPGEHDFSDDGYCLFLNTKNVTKNGFNFERESFITKEKHEKMRKGTLRRNDIVMTSRGSIGNIVLYTDTIPYEIVRINSAMLIIRNKDILMDVFFLEQLLKSRVISNFVNTSSVGSAQPHIKVKDLNSLKVTIPSDLREQYKIAGILRIIEKKIKKEKEKLMILESQKKGFMQGMFI